MRERERGTPVDDGALISCVGKEEERTEIGFGPGFCETA